MPSLWYQDAVFYEVYVRAFQDGNGDGIGDFVGLTSRLDYLQDLGVTCLWILPMYPSPLGDDGYDIADYRGIHPDYGTLDDFKRFLDEAHRRGIRVIADLVLNHTSIAHRWFQEARKGQDNPYHDYYVWSDTDQKYRDARIIFLDTERSNWTWDQEAGQFYWHRFFWHQPDLNYENPRVQEEMLEVFRFWMDMGLDGFRCDAIPYLFEEEGTSCENLPRTHAYLKELRKVMDREYPEAILLGEANQWPEDVRPYFGDGDELHMSFDFPTMPRLYESIRRGHRKPLDEIFAQSVEIPEGCQWATFLRNHDELTLEMVTPEVREWMWQEYAPNPRMKSNLGIRRRLWPLVDHDRRHVELLHSLLLSLPGSPVLYYGDEIGMGDNIWLSDRRGVRTPMQWDDSRNAGFSTAKPSELYLPVIVDPIYTYQAVNVEAARMDPSSFYHWLKAYLAARRHFRAFGRGSLRFVHPENQAIFAFLREYEGETLLSVNNLSGRVQVFDVPLPDQVGRTPVELATGTPFPVVASAGLHLNLRPWGFYWFHLE